MAAVALLGATCSGHGAFPPRPSSEALNTTVFIEGKPVHCLGDPWTEHTDNETVHGGTIASGSSNVYVGGRPMARIGDGIANGCASLISNGCANTVYCGG
jgi:uncharacterized Zn-binding protein involved in type VI secretion